MAEPSDLDRTISTVLATLAGGGRSADQEPPDVQGHGSAADGLVRVTAALGGHIESVEIEPAAMRLPSPDLAEAVRAATNVALADLRSAIAGATGVPDATAMVEQLREVQRTAVPQLQGFVDTLTRVQQRLASGERP
ncbi:YbaB/EbfC family nucleoid-associated protein [Micromonospora sp. AMSO31t]|uniref:YbaB/EbfC family nucleoid-associated protein n=1 Tax=Micromonospora sp. AMSO31t TaxID=2650566 RepID=UPI00124AF908|nr:YbaB/EbfC family nucleoid-associated protein [Micromonospora sp. AMSO31t]KAB1910847.1 YbaB/EbfC family nucleoid-associated protein [Micromonospora sp. AMSO31t]